MQTRVSPFSGPGIRFLAYAAAAALCLCLLLPAAARADRSQAQPRTALVIGNNAYMEGSLANAVNDARSMRDALGRLGFQVMYLENAGKQQMETAIQAFGKQLASRGGVGLFYYAGHGLQLDGLNYLIPVDVTLSSSSDVRYGCVGAELVLGKMEDAGNDVNIVILDACRENIPAFVRGAAPQGLAEMRGPTGSFIAYATAPGSSASDGDSGNGLYTKHILRNIYTPGLTLEELFKRVRIGVVNESGREQVPWDHSSLLGDFYFVEQGQNVAPASTTAPAKAAPQPQFTAAKKQTYTLPDGSVLQGEFTNNGRDGFGTLTWPDGGTYVGDFKGGMMDGNGVLTWPDGAVYQGQFSRHAMHGEGSIRWPDGTSYQGKWFEGYAAGGWFTQPGGGTVWARQDAQGNYVFPGVRN